MKRIVLLLLGALMLLSSCSNGLSDFRINSCSIDKIDNMNLTSGVIGTKAHLTVEYSNPSSKEFDVIAITGKAYLPSGKKLGRIKLPDGQSIHIDKKCVKKVEVPLQVTFSNPLALLSKSFMGELSDYKNALIDISITAKMGMQSRTFEKNGITIEQFIGQMQKAEDNEK